MTAYAEISCLQWSVQFSQAGCCRVHAGALPLYESIAVLGEATAEQEADDGGASDAEEPPQLATVLEQVRPCGAAYVLNALASHADGSQDAPMASHAQQHFVRNSCTQWQRLIHGE